MTCPNCEKDMAGNVPQCPHCGCRFVVRPVAGPAVKPASKPLSDPAGAPGPAAAAGESRACSGCGRTIPSQAAFCKWCGARVASEGVVNAGTPSGVKLCPGCNRQVGDTAVFCKWCGCSMREKEQPADLSLPESGPVDTD